MKKTLAWILTMFMILSMLPINVFAAGPAVAKIGETKYETLAAAIAAVKNGDTITLLADSAEKVTIKQLANVSFTIDGNGKTYTGTITIDGNRRSTGKETLTIKNLNFVLGTYGQSGIYATKNTYVHNLTVENCDFSCPATNAKGAYGIYLQHSYNIVLKNVDGSNLYDLVYARTAVTGFTAEDITVTDSGMGFQMQYAIGNATFKNVTMRNVSGAGVGLGNYNKCTAVFDNCDIDADPAVMLVQVNASNNFTVEFKGDKKPAANEVVVNEEVTGTTGMYTIEGLEFDSNFIKNPDGTYTNCVHKYVDGICVNGCGTLEPKVVAMIGAAEYFTFADAIAAVKNGETITLVAEIAENVTITQTAGVSFTVDGNGNIYTGTINVDGNIIGAETLTIKNVKFENIASTALNTFLDLTAGTGLAHNVTVDSCTFKSNEMHYAIKAKQPLNLVVNNCVAEDVFYFIYVG